MKSNGVLFIHNTPVWYRQPFFRMLSKKYSVKFVFTHTKVIRELYPLGAGMACNDIKSPNKKNLDDRFWVAFGVVGEALGEYEVLIGGNWDSLPDFFETLMYFIIVKFRRKKFILFQEEWDWKQKTIGRRLISPVVRFFVSRSDAVVVPGSNHKDYFMSLGAKKVFIAPNSCMFAPNDEYPLLAKKTKEKLGYADKRIILFVGRLIARKGVNYLIESFSHLATETNDTILMIVGEGEKKEDYVSLCEKLGVSDRVIFMGHINHEDLPPFYLLSDVCVVPSINERLSDAWGFTLNEAMQFGKPVIATTEVGAAFDMVKDGINGFLVPERDSIAIYNSLKKILFNPELRDKMGKESRRIIYEGFTYEHMVSGFSEAIDFCLGNKK